MAIDRNDIKGGSYELIADQWDQVTSKPGEPLDYTRYYQGDIITLNVEDARRLVLAGAVVAPGSREQAAAERAQAALQQALAQLSPEQRAAFEATLAEAREAGAAEVHEANGTKPRPAQAAKKEAWEEYAVSKGMTPEQANSLTKEQLVAAFAD